MPSVGENARYRRAHALIARWASGRFVVDNYLTRDRIELTPDLLQFIDTNPGPTFYADLIRAFASIDDNERLVNALIGNHIYIAEGSDEAVRDECLDATRAWDHVARWFHYGTRDTPFEPDITRQQRWLTELAANEPPPAPIRTYRQPVELPPPSDPSDSTVAACLGARRTARRWARTSLSSSDLSSLLWWTWGTQRFVEKSPIGPYQLKTSPSGGARHSIEVYPVALVNGQVKVPAGGQMKVPAPCGSSAVGQGVLLSVLGVFHSVGLAVCDDDGGVVQEAVEDADRGGVFG